MFSVINKLITKDNGDIIHEFTLNDYQVFLYMPKNDIQSNLINYGFTGPTILVFPDNKLEMDEVINFSLENGLTNIAKKNGVGIIFINPKGNTWENEEKGAYEAVAQNLGIAQSNFRNGLAIMKKPTIPDEEKYNILGSCVRMYVYGFKTGADYVATNYIKHVSGNTMLGDLGMADQTMVCLTLVNGTKLPVPEENDIHVVSINNSKEYNDILKKYCLEVIEKDEIDLEKDFIEVIGNYRRWAGKVVKAYNYDAEGIKDIADSVMLPIASDNEMFKAQGPFRKESHHKVGYVAFYDKNLDVKNGKVPLVLVFHGGGDSAYATASLAEWPEIGQREGFLTVAVEMHLAVAAKEVKDLIEHLKTIYSIDEERIYATGFSMGSIKSWDLYEQIPELFAGLMPMDAVDYVGNNCFFTHSDTYNETIMVPMFYVGGVSSPLVELPMHHQRACERLNYLAKVNNFKKEYNINFENKDNWEDLEIGVKGDKVEVLYDEMFPNSVYTCHYFDSKDGNCYTAIMPITNHAHEIRPFTNNYAWNFIKQFKRTKQGIEIIK